MNMSNDEQSYTISVIIPAYNAEEYVGRAIDSVLAQTRQPDEIIVVDDGSTDNTAEVIKSYGSKVCFIHQENGGASVARNTGIEAARSKWIAFLDADDEWLPEKLQLQIEHLRCNSDLVWTYSNYFVRSAVDNKQTVAFVGARYESLLRGGNYFEDYLNVHVGLWIRTSTVVIKREILLDTGLFRVGQMWGQDTDMFLRIAYRQPKIGFIPEPLAVYHADIPGCITLRNSGRIKQRCDFIQRHLAMAAQCGRGEDFLPCAVKMLHTWVRGMAREGLAADLYEVVERFADILPRPLIAELKLRKAFPRLSAVFFGHYFAVKNLLRSKQR